MRRLLARTLSVCLLSSGVAHAQTTPMLLALRHQQWIAAQAMAAQNPDPVAVRVVTFIRLLNQGQATAAELAGFLAANPGWPDQDTLERRYGEALEAEPDGRAAKSACDAHTPTAGAGLLRCAETWSVAGDARAPAAARQGFVALPGDPEREQSALVRWGNRLTQADHQTRFDRLEPSDADAAARQATRLDPPARADAMARLALRRRAPDALATLSAVPAALRSDPKLLLAQLRYLRRSGDTAAALALWRSAASQAEASVPQDRRPAFWTERDGLARDLPASGDAQSAYDLADDRLLTPEQGRDAHFLAGWIALRRLHDPARARARFAELADGSHAAITLARAFYWLAQVPGSTDSRKNLAQAAAWPTTYYGQLASRALGQSDASIQSAIAALRDPQVGAADTQALQRDELARAASLLVSWADPRRAADFLRVLAQRPGPASARAAIAQLATRLGVPDVAVLCARLAGRDGVVLGTSGWPVPFQPPPGPAAPALVLGVMRQESSFDANATSLSGARGLMQLMPATAAQVARGLGTQAGPLDDPGTNLELGAAYLGGLLAQFGGTEPYAIAAYNAGPHRARDWVTATPGADRDAAAMVDWIELIPFAETRNYVQRVLENEEIYRARLAPPARSAG